MTEEKPNLTVYRGWLDRGKHVWSPFVVKLEARLRFATVSYTADAGSTQKGPNGKIPYVECRGLAVRPSTSSEEKEEEEQPTLLLGDSTLIIKKLVEWDVLPDLHAAVAPAVRAQDLALRALLEEKLYFYHTRERWGEHYYTMRDHALSALSYPVRVLVGLLIYRGATQTLHGQGTGRYTAEEVASFRREIWEAVDALLKASKKFVNCDEPFWVLGGERPTEADATVFGFVVSVLLCTACPESQSLVKGFPVVIEYAGRIHDTYFPDYEKWK